MPETSRRTLVKGLAWLAPAITVAAVAPQAFAAPPMRPRNAGACSYPGQKYPWERTFRTLVIISNATNAAISMSFTDMTWRGASPTYAPTGSIDTDRLYDPYIIVTHDPAPFVLPFELVVPANTTLTPWLFWRGEGSIRGDLCLEFTLNGGLPTTQCASLKFGTDCGCSFPQPPYPPDTGKTC